MNTWWGTLTAALQSRVVQGVLWIGFCLLLYKALIWLLRKLSLSLTAKRRLRVLVRVFIAIVSVTPVLFPTLLASAAALAGLGGGGAVSLARSLMSAVGGHFTTLLSATQGSVVTLWSRLGDMVRIPGLTRALSRVSGLWQAVVQCLGIVAVVGGVNLLQRRISDMRRAALAADDGGRSEAQPSEHLQSQTVAAILGSQ